MRKYDENTGITLIALVVTIIVLLILAGVSVSMLTGQNGILNRATEAKEKTELSSKDGQRKLAQAEALMNNEKTTYKGITLPKGFASTKITGEDSIDDGLVITDGYGNEFVWVEVPKTIYDDTRYNKDNTAITENDTDKIKECLKEYTKEYKEENYEDTNTEDYTDMLKSIYRNGGFWIGRYEAGIEGKNPRTTESESISDNENPVIKQNKIPYYWVTREQARILSNKMNYDGCKSDLLYGIQWDLTLKFIEEKTVKAADEKNKNSTKERIISYLKNDSTQIGNYYNDFWNITNENAKYSEDKGKTFKNCPNVKEEEKSILLTTGANKKFSLANIYDIAGNVWEWTLEENINYPYVYRGGTYGSNGFENPAKSRANYGIGDSLYNVGFRIGLWNR